MGHSHTSPTTRNGDENFGQFLHERRLLLRREHQVSVALVCRGERRKNSAAHPEVRFANVRILFGAMEAKGNPLRVVCIDRPSLL